jgi:hypothetical protein
MPQHSQYIAFWSYAWDLVAEGLDAALERIATTGANGISLATSYHAGMLLLPHNPQQKVRFLEDGSLYFRPDPALFMGLAIQPRVSSLDNTDPLADICTAAARRGIEVTSWTVCTHNTWQGTLHPELAIHNAFGDPLVFALCPSQPEVQAYLQALLANLSRYPLRTLQLEAYDYMGFEHGFHHEKIQVELGPLSNFLLGICFCPACLKAAQERGLDGEKIRETAAAWLVRAFEGDVSEPECMSADVLEEVVPGMTAYLAMRDELTIQSIKGLAAASSVPLNLLGASPEVFKAVKGEIAEVTTCAYVTDPAVVTRVTTATRELVGPDLRAGIGLEVSPRFTPDAANMAAKINAARAAGAGSLYLYNYGLIPMRSLGWLRLALRG